MNDILIRDFSVIPLWYGFNKSIFIIFETRLEKSHFRILIIMS